MPGTNFATEQKEFYLFKGCQFNPCFVLHCLLSWRWMLGGGSSTQLCRAGAVWLLPCRTLEQGTELKRPGGQIQPYPVSSLAYTPAKAVLTARALDRQLVPSCPCTPGTIGPALFQARLCQEFSLFQLLTPVGLLRCSEH